MTCIVGYVDEDDTVWMGGDSAGVSGLDINVRKDKKVFKNGDFLMGFTSSFRMGNLLQYKFRPPEQECDDVFEYMCTDFIDGVRECFENGGFIKKSSDVESGGIFLVGYRGRLFRIDNDFQVGENVAPYAAVGCGEDYAYGSLYTTKMLENWVGPHNGYDAIRVALEAAENFSTGVRGPFTIIKL